MPKGNPEKYVPKDLKADKEINPQPENMSNQKSGEEMAIPQGAEALNKAKENDEKE